MQVHLSISLEQARAVERLARRAGEREGSPMLSELSLLASVAIVEAEGRQIREEEANGSLVALGERALGDLLRQPHKLSPQRQDAIERALHEIRGTCPRCRGTGRRGAWTCGCPAGVALDRARRARVEEMDRAEAYGDDSDAEARDAWAMRGTGR
jgi:hypothetical protein